MTANQLSLCLKLPSKGNMAVLRLLATVNSNNNCLTMKPVVKS